MAQTRECPLPSHKVRRWSSTTFLKTLMVLTALAITAPSVPSAHAQLQQPLVFSFAGAVASRNDQTGALTPVAGSPSTAVNQSLVIYVQGCFLFAISTSSIHMYQITDSTTGAYQEVACSPFASPVTHQPAYIAVEPSGQFIAVVDRVWSDCHHGSAALVRVPRQTRTVYAAKTRGLCRRLCRDRIARVVRCDAHGGRLRRWKRSHNAPRAAANRHASRAIHDYGRAFGNVCQRQTVATATYSVDANRELIRTTTTSSCRDTIHCAPACQGV
jgi:hypothetical protein